MRHLRGWSVIVFMAACAPLPGGPSPTEPSATGAAGSGAGLESRAPLVHDTRKYAKPSDAELRARLNSTQYAVTQHEKTEAPYRNAYWDNHEAGLYVDIVTGEPLFLSIDKYDSHTGWPSFTRPLAPERLVERPDDNLPYRRTEVRSILGDSHLGHVFNDGPPPIGLRYCLNSAALKFIPLTDLEAQGYGAYRPLFGDAR
jgi:peptide methionine sulfoxide reductase msrA/msrB